ncbi:KinB-signaling pathway activation protein [Effusibacillus dendaii]|uniref:KinB-signaling pathway activation protein n=1 Tax=Effusibacillus dendaii TaxID=2743772 RepID=A0A7I8DBB6_9BACL|nr:KinB-signaling pathway activation protein [Effusibacillus dendaii]BCJ87297.1 KinB-signaling pathway activation protein [Effusibacillus dendaii]
MNLKKFSFMVVTTVLVGILTGMLNAVTGLFANLELFFGFQAGGFVSATALMGFWAYLTLNFIVRGFLPVRFWRWLQVLVIVVVYIDFVYIRYITEGQNTGSIWPYVWFATWPLLVSIIAAYFKVKQSGKDSFVPALFFMYVFTIVEWFVALKSGLTGLTIMIGTILLACNTYLLLILGPLLRRSPQSSPLAEN